MACEEISPKASNQYFGCTSDALDSDLYSE